MTEQHPSATTLAAVTDALAARLPMGAGTVPIDWHGVWESALAILVGVHDLLGEQLAAGSSRPLLDRSLLAVDVFVDADLHAGSVALGDTTSVVLRGGLVSVVTQFPKVVAQVTAPDRDPRPSEALLDALADWIDRTASPADKSAVAAFPPGAWTRSVRVLVPLCLAFVVCHELAHLYRANAAEHAHDPGWAQASVVERTHALEHEADAVGYDLLLTWAAAHHADPAAAGRLAYQAAWTVLLGCGLVEHVDRRLLPTTHPGSWPRIARLRAHVQEHHGDHTRVVDQLGPDVTMVANEALRRLGGRMREADALLDDLLHRLRVGPAVPQDDARAVVARAYDLSADATLRRVEAVFDRPAEDPDRSVRQALWDVLITTLPAGAWNSFSGRLAPTWLGAWDGPRRRARLGDAPEPTS